MRPLLHFAPVHVTAGRGELPRGNRAQAFRLGLGSHPLPSGAGCAVAPAAPSLSRNPFSPLCALPGGGEEAPRSRAKPTLPRTSSRTATAASLAPMSACTGRGKAGVASASTWPPKSPPSPSGFHQSSHFVSARLCGSPKHQRPRSPQNRWWRRAAARASDSFAAPAFVRVLNLHHAPVRCRVRRWRREIWCRASASSVRDSPVTRLASRPCSKAASPTSQTHGASTVTPFGARWPCATSWWRSEARGRCPKALPGYHAQFRRRLPASRRPLWRRGRLSPPRSGAVCETVQRSSWTEMTRRE